MLHVTDLESVVFNKANICNEMFVISGYVGPEMIEKLAKLQNKTKLVVVYGMYGLDKISATLHQKLQELDNKYSALEIYYSTIPVHSKLYCWSSDGGIAEILIGSANFSVSGLRRDYKESLHEIPQASYNDYSNYQNYIASNWIRCTSANIQVKSHHKVSNKAKVPQPLLSEGICRMSLLDDKGRVPKKSGINWGYQRGHHAKSQLEAYIAIKAEYRKYFPLMFPEKKYIGGVNSPTAIGNKAKQNDDIELVWDDQESMIALMEGSKPKNGKVYPLQISSSGDKTKLGYYLRRRIVDVLLKKNKGYAQGLDVLLKQGKSFPVMKYMLMDYGRTHIDISMDGDGVYCLDFSV